MGDPALTPDDDDFWFERAADVVIGSQERQIKAADRITAALAWFWAAYTASALVAAGLAGATDDRIPGWVVAAPALLLFLAYATATWAALPVKLSFDDRVPNQIRAAYDQAYTVRTKRLAITYVLAAIAAVSVAGVVGLAVAAEKDPPNVIAISRSNDGATVVVGGSLPDVAEAIVTATPTDPKAGAATVHKAAPVTDGVLDATIGVDAKASYRVEVSWTADDQDRTTAEELKAR